MSFWTYFLRGYDLKLVRSEPEESRFRVHFTESGPVELFHSSFQTAWLGELGISPRTIVEIGAFDGGDALRFREAFPDAKVVSVEADPERAGVVRANCRDRRIDVVEVAVLDRDDEVAWHQAKVNGRVDSQGSIYLQSFSLNRRYPQVSQELNPVSVSGRRLESLCAELDVTHIDLLHMDIQGSEFAALNGLGRMRPSAIFLELVDDGWIGAGSVRDTTSLLDKWGYKLAARLRHDRLYVAPRQ